MSGPNVASSVNGSHSVPVRGSREVDVDLSGVGVDENDDGNIHDPVVDDTDLGDVGIAIGAGVTVDRDPHHQIVRLHTDGQEDGCGRSESSRVFAMPCALKRSVHGYHIHWMMYGRKKVFKMPVYRRRCSPGGLGKRDIICGCHTGGKLPHRHLSTTRD